jgi:phosphopantothenoylcysteine decarboxylase/phosphopantothenate--cysteine ligase
MTPSNTIVLGVTGSIAAYKAVELASKLTQESTAVDVVMTEGAQAFVTPLTFRSVTHRPVVTEMFDLASEFSVEHVSLAERADLVIIAPATANTIAKLATGIADNILCSTVLATKAPVLISPAMNVNMYENTITQENISRLKKRGFIFVGPTYGRLASGIQGLGRFADLEEIMGAIHQAMGYGGNLARRKIVVSAGGTREPIDPVRHISNRSSGKMGYAVAEVARDRGAEVILVTAPTALKPPSGVQLVQVETTAEMLNAIEQNVTDADVLIMAAAPADYRPRTIAKTKIKKGKGPVSLELVENPDIISEVKGDFIRVGFAAESENVVKNAADKLKSKNLDLIVGNDISSPDSGFDADTNKVVLIDRSGNTNELPLMSKSEVANRILDKVVAMLPERRKTRSK